jgi:DNA-binding NarL/FixJ family response regulator
VISVLLVDDHPVVIEGLRKVLATAPDIGVTGEAHDASGALERARTLKPDVILLDLRMPGASGVQAVRRLRDGEADGTGPAVIILTSYGDQAYVRQALEAGADGYLLKSTPPEALIAAIRAAARGRRQLSPELLDGVLQEFGGLAREQTHRTADLSPEDLEILRRASQGATNREIGAGTGRTEVAVKKRLQIIFDKLGAVDRAHAVAEAIRRGLI